MHIKLKINISIITVAVCLAVACKITGLTAISVLPSCFSTQLPILCNFFLIDESKKNFSILALTDTQDTHETKNKKGKDAVSTDGKNFYLKYLYVYIQFFYFLFSSCMFFFFLYFCIKCFTYV